MLMAAIGLAALPAATADGFYALLEVNGDDHQLAQVDNLYFNFEYLSSAGQTESVTIQTPAGFSGSLAQAVGTKLGTAGIGLLPTGTNISNDPSAAITRYTGSVFVMDPAGYAADQAAQACAPGTHTAVWSLSLANVTAGNLTLPVAVDASHGGYKLTICFDTIQAAGKEVEYLFLEPDNLFRNPGKHGLYLFDGVVTPFASTGGPDQATSYELRAYEALPQQLSVEPTYDPQTKVLTVAGKLEADGRSRGDVDIEVFGEASLDALSATNLGRVSTASDGSYTFTKKLSSLRYPYIYTFADDANGPTCPGSSALPAGCASTSIDGRGSSAEQVTVQS